MILVVIKFNIQDMASSFCILMEFKMTFEVKLVARALFRSHFPNQGRREKKKLSCNTHSSSIFQYSTKRIIKYQAVCCKENSLIHCMKHYIILKLLGIDWSLLSSPSYTYTHCSSLISTKI